MLIKFPSVMSATQQYLVGVVYYGVDPPALGGGPGAVVKAACWESRRSRARTPLWHSSFNETYCFFPAHS